MYKELTQLYRSGLLETFEILKPILIAKSGWSTKYLTFCIEDTKKIMPLPHIGFFTLINKSDLKSALNYRKSKKKKSK